MTRAIDPRPLCNRLFPHRVREDLQSFVDEQVDSEDGSDDDDEVAAQTYEDAGSQDDEDDENEEEEEVDDDDDGGAYMAELMGETKQAAPQKATKGTYSEMSLEEARRQAKSFSKLAQKGARKRTRAAADFGESVRGDDEMGMEKAMRVKEKSERRHANAPRKGQATAAPVPVPVEEDEPNPEMEAKAAKLLAAVENAGSKKKAAKKLRQDVRRLGLESGLIFVDLAFFPPSLTCTMRRADCAPRCPISPIC